MLRHSFLSVVSVLLLAGALVALWLPFGAARLLAMVLIGAAAALLVARIARVDEEEAMLAVRATSYLLVLVSALLLVFVPSVTTMFLAVLTISISIVGLVLAHAEQCALASEIHLVIHHDIHYGTD